VMSSEGSGAKAIACDAPIAPHVPGELRQVFLLVLPIAVGQMSTALASLVDVAMIGHLGANAVAAVGFGGLAFWVTVSLTAGIETAVQTLTARRQGEGRPEATGPILSEALRLSLLIGGTLGCGLALLAPTLLTLLHGDSTVRELGASYLSARALSLFFVMGVAAFRGFYNGTSRPRSHLRVALVILAIQVGLNAVLIYGHLGFPRLGVLGVGLSGAVASGIGLALFVILARTDREHGIFKRAAEREERRQLRISLVRLGLPSGLQWALSWIAMLVFLYLAGLVGVVEAGASYLLIQVASIVTLAANSFGFASASLVSQSLGRKQSEKAYRWGSVTARLAAGVLGSVGVGLALFREPLLSLLSADTDIVTVAEPVLLAYGLFAGLDAFGLVIIFSLIGAGAVRLVMSWNLIGMWLICLPVAWVLGVQASGGILGLWSGLFASRLLVALVMSFHFYRRRWASSAFEH
jgi:MATE family multidrug resistance protein